MKVREVNEAGRKRKVRKVNVADRDNILVHE